MRWAFSLMVTALVVAPWVVRAQQLDLSASAKLGYDSNVFSREDETDSGAFRFGGEAALSDTLERASYRVYYRPVLLVYSESQADEAMNHRASAVGDYLMTPRWSVGISNHFSHQERVRQPVDTQPGVSAPDGGGTLTTNELTLRSSYLITKRLSVRGDASRSFFRRTDRNRQDSDHFGGTTSFNYAITQHTNVGIGGNVGYRWFDERNSGSLAPPLTSCNPAPPGSRSLNYQGFASFSHEFDERTVFSFSGGPAQIDTTNYQCQLVPGSPFFFQNVKKADSNFTWFASANFSREWEKMTIDASYRRSEGLSGDQENSSINNYADLRLRWHPDRRWTIAARGAFTRRETEGNNRVTQATDTWSGSVRVRRAIAERTSLSVDGSYIDQSSDSGLLQTSDSFNAFRIFFGIEYDFDPIRF